MPINHHPQPNTIQITNTLRLTTPTKPNWQLALPWYQNPKVLYYSEGITDKVYDLATIERMYSYLSKIGELYFIEILEGDSWRPIGDVTLSAENMPIAIGDEQYWGKGIGKKVISVLLDRASKIGMTKISIPTIYLHNHRSENLFKSMGFVEVKKNETEKSFQLSY